MKFLETRPKASWVWRSLKCLNRVRNQFPVARGRPRGRPPGRGFRALVPSGQAHAALAERARILYAPRAMADATPEPPSETQNESPMERLLRIMARLRDPESGCPWGVEQTFASIAPYTIEEAYEVADAIAHDDLAALKDELGDLLLQVVYHARMAEEAGAFDFAAVAAAIGDKMVRRHPHVFGDTEVKGAAAQTLAWEEHKAAERRAKAEARGLEPSRLEGVALGLPGLTRALKLQRRAARAGFDWPRAAQVLDKIEEEVRELRAELPADDDGAQDNAHDNARARERLEDELGDLLFAVANLARHVEVDPESALRRANQKFERRFRAVEARFGESLERTSLDDMEAAWQAAKAKER